MIQLKVSSLIDSSSSSPPTTTAVLITRSFSIEQTMLNCIDNSGAALVECALVVGQKRHARIGTNAPSQRNKQKTYDNPSNSIEYTQF